MTFFQNLLLMNKNRTQLLVLCLAGVLLMLPACQREQNVSPAATKQQAARNTSKEQQYKFSSNAEYRAYKEKHLGTLGKLMMSVATDDSFKDMLYKRVEEKFDGEHNVLFETIISDGKAHGLQANSEKFFSDNGIADSWQEAKDAFRQDRTGLNDNYFPQLYIPSYQSLKKKNLLKTKPPVFIVFGGDDEQYQFQGYTLDAKGKIVKTPFMVDEAYAADNEVWVMSINERTVNGVVTKKPQSSTNPNAARWSYSPTTCSDGNDALRRPYNPSAPFPMQNPFDVKIGALTIKCHNESFAGGGSEIFLSVTSAWCGSYNPGNGSYDPYQIWGPSSCFTYLESQRDVDWFSREDVNRQTTHYINYSMVLNNCVSALYWDSPGDPRKDCIYFVLYERDNPEVNGPRSYLITSSADYGSGSNSIRVWYDSAHNGYSWGWMNWYKNDSNGYMCGWSYDDGCGRFNTYTEDR